jgi:hypothetical protein
VKPPNANTGVNSSVFSQLKHRGGLITLRGKRLTRDDNKDLKVRSDAKPLTCLSQESWAHGAPSW